jgi:hypothetical protein
MNVIVDGQYEIIGYIYTDLALSYDGNPAKFFELLSRLSAFAVRDIGSVAITDDPRFVRRD